MYLPLIFALPLFALSFAGTPMRLLPPPPLLLPPTCPPAATATVTVTANNPSSTSIPTSQCNTGPIQCCTTSQKASGESASPLLGFLGIAIEGADPLVGIGCSPFLIGGGGSSACSATPLCCENNTFNGIIAVGCVVINVYL